MPFRFRSGVHPDLPDQRDWIHPRPRLPRLPASVDLRPDCPPVYQQGALNSCTANAIGAAMAYDAAMRDRRHREPSRLFIYYNERAREGVVGTNAPVSLRDGYRAVARVGVCPERLWPYDPPRFRRKPPLACFDAASKDRAIAYFRIPARLDRLRGCLAQRFPFTMGISVYESFLTPAVARSGRVPMPDPSEAPKGGHAVLVVGYRDASEHFIVRNSWGRGWGDDGYCFFPYAYLLNQTLAFDFWTVRRTTA
jgi:C1A family cysteine protease